jgi:phosphate starvation-inducible PhoH-like protein
MADQKTDTPQTVQHRLPAEGADQLVLAGVNDENLQELARVCGCRVVLRDDHLVLSGALGEVERCVPIAQHMIDLARMEKPFSANDIQRFADVVTEREGLTPSSFDASKIVLPGTRKIITPKSAGQ